MNRLDIAKKVRRKILAHIKNNPGRHFSEILRRLKLSSGRLTYHILKLEEAEKIFAKYDGYWKRFYPISAVDDEIPESLTPKQAEILRIVGKHPGSTYMKIVDRCGKTRQAIYYHMKKLVETGKIRIDVVKGKHFFYVEKSGEGSHGK